MNAAQLQLGDVHPGGPLSVPPGDFARPGLVDHGLVDRSVAAMREQPDAEDQLRRGMAQRLESLDSIYRGYPDELNEWAIATRDRLWMEYFTADAIFRRLTGQPVLGRTEP